MTLNLEHNLIEPLYPEEWACCNSGCGDQCVYEIYRREKQAYDEMKKKLQQQTEVATSNNKNEND